MTAMDGNKQQTGEEGPQANALKHGLTATKFLPKILRPGRLPEIVAAYRAEYQPQTETEKLLVQEIARHTAALEVTEEAEPAVWRTAAQALSQVASLEQAAPTEDLQLAAAVTTEPLVRAARYRRSHEKALHQTLDKLRNLQAAGAATRSEPAPDWTEQFRTEAGCEANLQQRFLAGDWHCPRCRRPHGHWLPMRTDNVFQVREIFALQPREDPNHVLEQFARCCKYYGVSVIAADGNGNGHVYNRMLFAKVQPRYGLYGIYYSAGEHEPTADGALWSWTVNRSRAIGGLFARIKVKKLIFPCRQDADEYLDEFACETAVYDDQQRTIKYTHPQTHPDDTLHATNYALLIATRAHHAMSGQSSAVEFLPS